MGKYYPNKHNDEVGDRSSMSGGQADCNIEGKWPANMIIKDAQSLQDVKLGPSQGKKTDQ